MAALRGLRHMLCVLPLVALVGCKGIEKGDKIDHLQMIDKSTINTVLLQPGGQLAGYQCLRQQLGVVAVFERNGSADYSTRPAVHWSSSNSDIVHVSDGDEADPINPGRIFPKGVITPLREGNSTITAEYAGLTVNIQVIVSVPDSIILSTSKYDSKSDASAVPVPGAFNMATGSSQQYFVYAKLKDLDQFTVYRDVTGNAFWSLPNDSGPDGGHVSVTNPETGLTSGGGLVTALSPGGPIEINANFSACPGSDFENIKAQVNVSNISSLAVTHDPNFLALASPPLPLVVGTSEAFVATATLENGKTQDLSYQALFTTDTGSANILAFTSNVASALDTGTAQVVANFRTVKSPALSVQTQKAILSSYAISPGFDPVLGPPVPVSGAPNDKEQYIDYQGFHAFHALGTFRPDVPPGAPVVPFVQDITQNTLWTSSSTDDVVINSGGELAGIAVSRKSKQTCVTITGKFSDSAFDSTALGVGAPVSNSTCP